MKKLLFISLLSCLITSCNKKNEQNKEAITYTENKIKDELISKTTILIDSVFNEISPDYLDVSIDSIQVYKYFPLKGEKLENLMLSQVSTLAIDKDFIDVFIKNIESEKAIKDSIIGYIGFLQVKSKVKINDEYILLLTDDQKLEAQSAIEGSKKSYFIPNILTSDLKQFDLKKLNKN